MQPVSEQRQQRVPSLIVPAVLVSLFLTACDALLQEPRPSVEPPEVGGVGTTQIDVGGLAGEIQLANGLVWVMVNRSAVADLDEDTARIVRIDPRTGRVRGQPIPIQDLGVVHPRGFDVGEGFLWALSATLVQGAWDKKPGALVKIDPDTGRIVGRVKVGRDPFGVTVAHGAVWVTNRGDNNLLRLDPKTMKAMQTIPVGEGPHRVLSAFGSIWVANEFNTPSVMRVDPRTATILATIVDVERPVPGVGVLWVEGPGAAIRGIDPRTNEFAGPAFPLNVTPAYVAGGKRSVWIGRWDTTVTGDYDPHSSGVFKYRRYDPEENALVGPEVTVLEPLEGRVGFGSLWVPHPSEPTVLSTPES